MSFSAKKFLQQYGVAGVVAYGGVTVVSVTSIYAGLRSGVDIILPIEKCLGSDSELVQNLKAKLGDTPSLENGTKNGGSAGKSINWAREATYFGIAGALDSFVLPFKLMVLPTIGTPPDQTKRTWGAIKVAKGILDAFLHSKPNFEINTELIPMYL